MPLLTWSMPRCRKDQRGSKSGDGSQHGQAGVPNQVHRITAVRPWRHHGARRRLNRIDPTGPGSACWMGVALAMVIGTVCAVGAWTK
ncbi:MAG: hypothetical protein LC749_05080 [Actinobacteria bacterium]|nr:hypothetical protein [Actinomycetota bacterium]